MDMSFQDNDGFLSGLFGCFKPVLTIIGKAAVNENSRKGVVVVVFVVLVLL